MKYISIIALILLLTNNIFSQSNYEVLALSYETEFGIKAGYNAIQMQIENDGNNRIQKEPGIYFGAFVNFPTSEIFSIQPEVLYSSSRYNINDNISLIHIPVLIKFKLANSFTGSIGPEAQILLGIGEQDTSSFNQLMFGFNFGATYRLTPKFLLEARPYFALNKLLKDGPGFSRKLNTLQIGLAYEF